MHICFFRRHRLGQAALDADSTPINTILPVVGIMPQRRRSFCGALLRESKIPPTVVPRMRARLTGDRILPPDVSQTYHQDWQLRLD
jgi:hypothetical protein